jgi:hypothetical protein
MFLACLRGQSAATSSSDLKREITESIRDFVNLLKGVPVRLKD